MTSNDTAKLLYGGEVTSRKLGHRHFMTEGRDANGLFTEGSPAVIHCRGDATFMAAAEAFIQSNPGTTIPELVKISLDVTLANQQRGARLFYLLDGDTVETGRQFYGQLMGNVDAPLRLVDGVINDMAKSRALAGIGPYAAGRTGLLNSSAAQVAAEALGLVSYDSKGSRRLAAGKVTLPGSSVVARGTSAAASRRPLAKPSIRDDESIMAMLRGAVLVIATDVLYRKALSPKTTKRAATTVIKAASRYYGAQLVRFIISRGLTDQLRAEFDKANSVAERAMRMMLLDSFWTDTVGLPEAPSADFGGKLGGFTDWLAEAVATTLKASPEQQVEAGADADAVTQRLTFFGHFKVKGSRWNVSVVNGEKEQLRAVLSEQLERIERTRKGTSINGAIPFPALPLVGECGGQLAVVASKRRANWLIKHSRKGTPQALQAEAAKGLAMQSANAASKGANLSVTEDSQASRTGITYRIDADAFKG